VFGGGSTRRPCSRARPPLLTCVPPQCHAPPCALLLHNECQSFHTPSSHSRCRFSLRQSLCAELRPWPPLPYGKAPTPSSFFHLRVPHSPASTATCSAILSLALRAPSRLFFSAVAHGHRCRGRRRRLCARPGQHGPSPIELSGPMHVHRTVGAPHSFVDAVDNHSRWSREPAILPTLPS